MRSKRRCNPASEWVVKEKAFQPLIDDTTFKLAQKHIEKRRTRPPKPDDEVIEQLRRLLARKGRLSHHVIKKAKGLFEPRTYYSRFGSYLNVYKMVGYQIPPERLKSYRRATNGRVLRNQILEELAERFPDHVQVIRPRRNARKVLGIDSSLYRLGTGL